MEMASEPPTKSISPSKAGPSQETIGGLHIVSWNVASWATTLKLIQGQYGSLKAWADKHFVDILCLQEVKSTVSKLEKEPSTLAALEPSFDTFFNLCRPMDGSVSTSKVGFNGVATFARKGLTLSANTRCLGAPDLDSQGRCIETEHGDFVIFNIYAPYDGHDSQSLVMKMRFLTRLRHRMSQVRMLKRKPVILVGDFNARYRLIDSSPEMRYLDTKKLLSGHPIEGEPRICAALREALLDGGLTSIKQSIARLELQPFGPNGKVRVFARHPKNNELKRINAPNTLWTREQAEFYRPFQGLSIDGGVSPKDTFGFSDRFHSSGHPVSELDERTGDVRWVVKVEDSVCLDDLRVLTQELLDLQWSDADFNEFAKYEAGGWLLPGKICTSSWIETLIEVDGMMDSFAAINPKAEGRYTVWCQQTNDRFSNLGSRIDFIFVDKHDRLTVPSNTIPLYGCVCRSKDECAASGYHCADASSCALNAATSYGRWKPAPFAGGGLPPGSKQDHDTQFLRQPHTGIIYTPPTLSDHVATSCVLSGLSESMISRKVTLQANEDTKLARPFTKQTTLAEFFVRKKHKQEE